MRAPLSLFATPEGKWKWLSRARFIAPVMLIYFNSPLTRYNYVYISINGKRVDCVGVYLMDIHDNQNKKIYIYIVESERLLRYDVMRDNSSIQFGDITIRNVMYMYFVTERTMLPNAYWWAPTLFLLVKGEIGSRQPVTSQNPAKVVGEEISVLGNTRDGEKSQGS